jgi:hypothetical protein
MFDILQSRWGCLPTLHIIQVTIYTSRKIGWAEHVAVMGHEKCIRHFSREYLKEKHSSEDHKFDRRIILKWTLKNRV